MLEVARDDGDNFVNFLTKKKTMLLGSRLVKSMRFSLLSLLDIQMLVKILSVKISSQILKNNKW